MKIYRSFTELVGKTPLFELQNVEKEQQLKATVSGKTGVFQSGGQCKRPRCEKND